MGYDKKCFSSQATFSDGAMVSLPPFFLLHDPPSLLFRSASRVLSYYHFLFLPHTEPPWRTRHLYLYHITVRRPHAGRSKNIMNEVQNQMHMRHFGYHISVHSDQHAEKQTATHSLIIYAVITSLLASDLCTTSPISARMPSRLCPPNHPPRFS